MRVHQAGIDIALTAIHSPAGRQEKSTAAPVKAGATRLRLAILTCPASGRAQWEDGPDARLESELDAVAAEIAVAAELAHRAARMRAYEWRVKRKAELEEEARRRKLEAERKERELAAKRERERTERLLAQATALRQADDIRAYAAAVRAAAERPDFPASPQQIESWSAWALAHADRIDPLSTAAFLGLIEDEPQTACSAPPADIG